MLQQKLLFQRFLNGIKKVSGLYELEEEVEGEQ